MPCKSSRGHDLNETLLEQAVINMLVNAIKYSHKGGEVVLQAHGGKEDVQSEEGKGTQFRVSLSGRLG